MTDRIERRENEIKTAFVTRFETLYARRFYLLFQHQDMRKSGWPDISLHGFGKSTQWEFKHGTPNFSSPGIQELTCLRLQRRSFCRYVIFVDHPDRRETLIALPSGVYGHKGKTAQIAPIASWEGHDYAKLAHYMHEAHKS